MIRTLSFLEMAEWRFIIDEKILQNWNLCKDSEENWIPGGRPGLQNDRFVRRRSADIQ